MFSFLYLKEMLRLIDYLNLCFKNVFEEKIFFLSCDCEESLKRLVTQCLEKNKIKCCFRRKKIHTHRDKNSSTVISYDSVSFLR